MAKQNNTYQICGSIANFKCSKCEKPAIIVLESSLSAKDSAYCEEHLKEQEGLLW